MADHQLDSHMSVSLWRGSCCPCPLIELGIGMSLPCGAKLWTRGPVSAVEVRDADHCVRYKEQGAQVRQWGDCLCGEGAHGNFLLSFAVNQTLL